MFGAWIVNSNWLHLALQRRGLTASSARPNPWYEAFYSNLNRQVLVLNLKDGRRVYGWPQYWPNTPNGGHIFLTDAEWYYPEHPPAEKPKFHILIDVADVAWIEFVPLLTETNSDVGG
jgi:hypothetical protein